MIHCYFNSQREYDLILFWGSKLVTQAMYVADLICGLDCFLNNSGSNYPGCFVHFRFAMKRFIFIAFKLMHMILEIVLLDSSRRKKKKKKKKLTLRSCPLKLIKHSKPCNLLLCICLVLFICST